VKLLLDDGTTRIFTDGENLLVTDPAAIYLYHVHCGGVKMFHLLYGSRQEAQELVESLDMTPLCRCYRPKVRFVDRHEKDPVQQVLANVFIGLGTCRSLEDARLMVEELASREEMHSTEQLL
jgi:hypothetical protein